MNFACPGILWKFARTWTPLSQILFGCPHCRELLLRRYKIKSGSPHWLGICPPSYSLENRIDMEYSFSGIPGSPFWRGLLFLGFFWKSTLTQTFSFPGILWKFTLTSHGLCHPTYTQEVRIDADFFLGTFVNPHWRSRILRSLEFWVPILGLSLFTKFEHLGFLSNSSCLLSPDI